MIVASRVKRVLNMLAWFEQLSLRAKLVLGFGTLICLMHLGGATALLGHERTLAAVEVFFEGDNRIAELSLESSAAMGKARRYEKEFASAILRSVGCGVCPSTT